MTLKREDRLAANALHFAAAKTIVSILLHPLHIGGNDLELQAGASRVQDKNVHCTVHTCYLPGF
jgi:hypothetical protein